jgi:hypothetical protein
MQLKDIRRYVCYAVLREEDGRARKEEEWTMRREEEEEDAKSRERRGGTAMGEPHAWRGWQARGDNGAGIQNHCIVKYIIQCQDFPLIC